VPPFRPIAANRRIIGEALGSIIAIIITIHMTAMTAKVARDQGAGIGIPAMVIEVSGAAPKSR
jgi:hypothetical protein